MENLICPICRIKNDNDTEHCTNCDFPISWYYNEYIIGDINKELLIEVKEFIENISYEKIELSKIIEKLKTIKKEKEKELKKLKEERERLQKELEAEKEKLKDKNYLINLFNLALTSEYVIIYYKVKILEPRINLENGFEGCLLEISFKTNVKIDNINIDIKLPDFVIVKKRMYDPLNIEDGEIIYTYSSKESKTTNDKITIKLSKPCEKDSKFKIFAKPNSFNFIAFEVKYIKG